MRRPWNIIDHPVYLLNVEDESGYNSCICTYVTAISRKPKLYAIAIEEGSKTLSKMKNAKECVLQILSKDQSYLVKPLGKKSGHQYDKQQFLEKRNALFHWNDKLIANDAVANLLLDIQSFQKAGDHFLFIAKVIKSKTIQEDNILMFHDLIDQKIIL